MAHNVDFTLNSEPTLPAAAQQGPQPASMKRRGRNDSLSEPEPTEDNLHDTNSTTTTTTIAPAVVVAAAAAASTKRHRFEPIEPTDQATQANNPADSGASDDSDDSDDGDFGQDVNVDSSCAPSPLNTTNMDPDTATAPYTRFAAEEMEIMRSEARTLGLSTFLDEYIGRGVSLRALLEVFGAPFALISSVPDFQLLPLLRNQMVRFYRHRPKLSGINSVQDVVDLLQGARRIMVLTGAGVSVSCGIPDFRSPTGIYTRLNDEFGLDDPQQMFDIEYFRETPELFYSFAKELYPYNFTPAPTHAFVKLLEDEGRLLRNYTQNIDTLEHVQGISRVLNCHGSFATATCIKCGYACDGKALEEDIMAMRIAFCPQCKDGPSEPVSQPNAPVAGLVVANGTDAYASFKDDEDDDDEDDMDYGVVRGIMKPDITFFGEKLPDQFDEALLEDRDQVDLLLVMGSSLKVAPVSDIMSHLPHNIPQVVINKTPILHLNFDVQLLGDADDIVAFLARECGWELRHEKIPGGSTGSKEFMDSRRCPVAEEKGRCVTVPVKVKEEGGAVSVGERKLGVPAHWHLFESAVVTPRDLLVASGEERVRLAEEESSDDDDEEGEDEDEDVSDGGAA